MQKIPLKTQYRSTFPDLKPGFFRSRSRFFKIFIFIFSDLSSICITFGIANLLQSLFQETSISTTIEEVCFILFTYLFIFWTAGLYSQGISPVEELRRLTIAISVFVLTLAAFSFFLHKYSDPSVQLFVGAWILALILVPLGRELTRHLFIRSQFWGEPVVVIGYGPAGFEIAEYLVDNPQSGLYPVVVVDRRTSDRNITPRVPVIRASDILEHPEMIDNFKTIQMAILVSNEINDEFVDLILEEQILHFPHLVVVSSAQQINSLWARPYKIGEMLGFEIGQNLLNKWHRAVKRLIDLCLIVITLPVAIPLFLLLILLIKLDSPGNFFHHQMRLGYKNKFFKMLEFRSMYSNSDKLLKSYLAANPEMQEEWNVSHKLNQDPRITRFGHFLRKSTLIKLPQLINVIKGEMSLIGPVPIAHDEVKLYGSLFPLYCKVLPGITGLSQISGSHEKSYISRSHLDESYIRNWSIWLDYFILTRTALIVLFGKDT